MVIQKVINNNVISAYDVNQQEIGYCSEVNL